jgi:hypothetical protein
MIVKKVLLLIFAAGVFITLSAQSMRWADGKEFARKLSNTLYEPVPAGVVSYKVENGQFWELLDGISKSDKPKGYSTYANGSYSYFNSADDLVAEYIHSEGRYYTVSGKGEGVKKEAHAVLLNGVLLVVTGGDESLRYTVEEGFDPVVIGFFLFIH